MVSLNREMIYERNILQATTWLWAEVLLVIWKGNLFTILVPLDLIVFGVLHFALHLGNFPLNLSNVFELFFNDDIRWKITHWINIYPSTWYKYPVTRCTDGNNRCMKESFMSSEPRSCLLNWPRNHENTSKTVIKQKRF